MTGEMPNSKPQDPRPEDAKPEDPKPEDDGLYRAIMMVLVGSILLGAVLTLIGESLFGSRPLSTVGLGMAVLAGVAYWGLRIKARAASRRAEAAAADPGRDRKGG